MANHRNKQAQPRAADHLPHPVAQRLIQPGDKLLQILPALWAVLFQVLDNMVDGPGVKPGSPADAGGIVHDNQGQHKAEGEDGGVKAVHIIGGQKYRADHSRVGAGHPPSAGEPAAVELLMLDSVYKGLDGLSRGPGENADVDKGIGDKDTQVHGVSFPGQWLIGESLTAGEAGA